MLLSIQMGIILDRSMYTFIMLYYNNNNSIIQFQKKNILNEAK